jgi:hypothetical protein
MANSNGCKQLGSASAVKLSRFGFNLFQPGSWDVYLIVGRSKGTIMVVTLHQNGSETFYTGDGCSI